MKTLVLVLFVLLFSKISFANSVTVDQGTNSKDAICVNGWGTPYKCTRDQARENAQEKVIDSISNENVRIVYKVLNF